MDDQEYNAIIDRCIEVAVAQVNEAREEGETDLRSVRGWIESALSQLKRK